jgi:hypothetical protein
VSRENDREADRKRQAAVRQIRREIRGKESSTVKRIRNTEPQHDYKAKSVKRKRKECVKATKDKVRNIKRATENTGAICIVCGKRIKKGQSIRTLSKDRNCQEVRLYHLRTCGPGSDNWKSFKAQGKKTPKRPFQWQQLSFQWKAKKG